MYLPEHFKEARPEALHHLIRSCPLGILVTAGAAGIEANHIPFHLDTGRGDNGYLMAHVARANPVWQAVRTDEEVLVIFSSGNAYISPNWYPSKHTHHRQVPTWNYQAVHVRGKINVRQDETFIRGVVAHLTRENETRAGVEKIWKMSDAPGEFISQMLAAIVGIEIEISEMAGKWKLSQNRNEDDRRNAARELGERGERVIASAMLDVK